MDKIKYLPAGDMAIVMEFGNIIDEKINLRVKSVYNYIMSAKMDGIVDCVPTFRSLLVYYDPLIIRYDEMVSKLNECTKKSSKISKKTSVIIEIPVVYGGAYGEDMQNVSKHTGLSADEIINIHSEKPYLIYMLGFLPGFAYLGGMDKRLETPRLQNPRTKIPWGSIGIGGAQTGIYPLESPGGWQLIGRTPLKPYDPNRQNPFLFNAGDYIKFKPITEKEYLNALKEQGYGI